jgi:hypothetical protein
MLFDPNATVTIGRVETDVTPRAPSLNTPSEYAILPDDPDAAEPTWTTRAQVRDTNAAQITVFQLTPNLNEKKEGKTFSIFFAKETKIPSWLKPGNKVYAKKDDGAIISGSLRLRRGLTNEAITNGWTTPYFVTELGAN